MSSISSQLANLASKYGQYLLQSEEQQKRHQQELADRQALGAQLRAARLAQNQADQQTYAARQTAIRQAAPQNVQQANIVPVASLRAPTSVDRAIKIPFVNYENTSGGVSDLAPVGDILKHIGSGISGALSGPATFIRSLPAQITGKLGSVSNPGSSGYYSALQAASDLAGKDIDKKISSVPVVGPALDAAANFVADNATDPTAYMFGSGISGAKGVSTIDRGMDLDRALNTARSVKQAENLTRSSGVLHAANVLPEASRLVTPFAENGKLFGSVVDRDAGVELHPSWVTNVEADTKGATAVKHGWVTDTKEKFNSTHQSLLPDHSELSKTNGFPYRNPNADYGVVQIPQERIDQLTDYVNKTQAPAIQKQYKAVLKEAFQGSSVESKGTGINGSSYFVNISQKGIKESLSRQKMTPQLLGVLEKLDSIIEDSEFKASAPDTHLRSSVKRSDIFDTQVKLGDQPSVVRTRVNNANGTNNFYFMGIQKAEDAATPPRSGLNQIRATVSGTSTTDSIPKYTENASDSFNPASSRVPENTSRAGDAPEKAFVYSPSISDLNSKTWYHGSGTKGLTSETLSPNMTKIEGLYGHGVYLTDDPEIARKYASMRAKRTGTPVVYESKVHLRNSIDLEKPLPDDVYQAIQNTAKQLDGIYGSDISDYLTQGRTFHGPGKLMWRNFTEKISDLSRDEGVSSGELSEYFQDLTGELKDLGYDGFTHVGGNIKGSKLHQVAVVFDPNSELTVTRYDPNITLFHPVEPDSMVQTGMMGSGEKSASIDTARPLGAQTAAEPYREKTSDFYTSTVKNSPMFTDAEKSMAISQAPKEQIISEKQSLTEARQRLETDFDGEVDHLSKTPTYTGADVDTAMGVTEAYLQEARQTGDYSKALGWINQVADRAGESGRSLQALQKYSRTSEGLLVQGTKMINDAAKKTLEGKAGLTPTGHKLENALRAIQNALKDPDALSNPETAQKIAQILKGDKDTADQIMRLAESGKGADVIKSALMQKFGVPSLTSDDMGRVTELMGQYSKATDPAEKNALAVQVSKIIGNRLPAGFFEKVDQWRYTSMLFNMLTNVRNVLGNAASYTERELKNVTGVILKKALPVEERTSAILTPADKPLRDFAEKAYQSVKFDLESTSKLDFRNMISDNRRIYNTRALEWLRTSSNWLLDKEDDIGLHKVFTNAFAEGMKARHLTPEFLASDAGKVALESLQKWSGREATRTMFHEASGVAQLLNRWENSSKAGKLFIGGMLPFKQTPIDILKQGARYSPLGLLKGVTYDVAQLRRGNISKLEFIDNLAAGLTGTELAAVGAWLGSMGLVTTASDASGNAENFQTQQQGYQDYALKIGNKTYTLDWLSPAAMPFFFGAELWKSLFGNESLTTSEKVQQGFGRMLNAMTKVTDPLMNLSMLQSVNDMLNSAKYGVGNAISTTAQNAVQSYVGQYFPSQLGAFARATTPYKKTAYASAASPFGKAVEQTGRSAMQKIPGLNQLLPNSIDQWGQPVSSGTPVERILNNFFSPGKLAGAKADPVNDEISRIYQSTGDSAALPKTAAGYFVSDGARYDLTPTEKEKYATVLGQTAHEVVAQLIGSGEYDNLSGHAKVLALSRVYSDAASKAKKTILDARGVKNKITVGSSKSRKSLYRDIDSWVTQ